MKWIDVLVNAAPEAIVNLCQEIIDDYSPSLGRFCSCPDDYIWFRVRGLKHTINCTGDCVSCLLKFLYSDVDFEVEGDVDV